MSNRRIKTGEYLSSDHELLLIAVLGTVELDGYRLLLLRSSRPGAWSWTGASSDGSREWTAEWMMKLNHRFGDDDEFWISYQDFLRQFSSMTTDHVFGDPWKTCQLWAAFQIPWSQDALQEVFHIALSEDSDVVIALSQLDPSYFRGLEGQYVFELEFTLSKMEGTRFARSGRRHATQRRNNVVLRLESGVNARRLKESQQHHLCSLTYATEKANGGGT
jgi:hypothetical protein